MFAAIARFDVRFRWLIVAVWIAGVIVALQMLPSLASVIQSNNAQFLSAQSPSRKATQLSAPFVGKDPSSTAVMVVSRAAGPLTSADNAAFAGILQATRRIPAVSLVRDEGVSQDGHAREALVVTSASVASEQAAKVVSEIRGTFTAARRSPGLRAHLTGQLAVNVDYSNGTRSSKLTRISALFIIVLLVLVFRAALAPLITLIPAALSLALAGPLIAAASKAGLTVSSVAQQLLIVLILGAGTDYGLFIVFRFREELRRGADPVSAVVGAVERVGETITYSALTVVAAVLTLLLAPFGIYRDLGPSLAIGLAVMLVAALTLTPALLAIFGRAVFWPARPKQPGATPGLWARAASVVVRRPVPALLVAVLVFGGLAAGLAGYQTGGFTNGAPTGSDSAAGADVLAAHFPQASVGAEELLLKFPGPVWQRPAVLAEVEHQLSAAPVFGEVRGPGGGGRAGFSPTLLAHLHAVLGSAALLPETPPAGTAVSPAVYAAYRATAQFISPDGRTVAYYAVLRAGAPGSAAAINAIPPARAALARVATSVGAQANGVAGEDSASYDISHASNDSLLHVVPAVLVIILVLLALLLRSLVAPWYLMATVGLSYVAALGFAMIIFVHLGTEGGLNFVLPFLLFIFSMALGEDYSILMMSRIREESMQTTDFSDALRRAVAVTSPTVASAGIVLTGTFVVLGAVGGNSQARQIGFGIAFGVLLVAFFVQPLINPAITVLLGARNWWPSKMSHTRPAATAAAAPGGSGMPEPDAQQPPQAPGQGTSMTAPPGPAPR